MQNAKAILSGDEDSAGILSALSEAVTAVQDAGRYMEELRALSGRVESLYYELEECAEELRDQAQRLDFDEGELEQVENRLDLLRRLSDKYGGSEEAVLAYLEQARQELDAIEMSDEHVARLQEQLAAARDETIAAAEKLTEARPPGGAALFGGCWPGAVLSRHAGRDAGGVDRAGAADGDRRGQGGIPHCR